MRGGCVRGTLAAAQRAELAAKDATSPRRRASRTSGGGMGARRDCLAGCFSPRVCAIAPAAASATAWARWTAGHLA